MIGVSTGKPGKLTAAEVHRLVEAGMLGDDRRVELIEGELVQVTPQGSEHSVVVSEAQRRLADAYGRSWFVQSHSPVQGNEDTIPEPDLAVVSGKPMDFLRGYPGPDKIALVVEVAVTSRRIDLRKARVYAEAGYPTLWILDIPSRSMQVLTSPSKSGYASVRELSDSDEIELPGTGLAIPLKDLLP